MKIEKTLSRYVKALENESYDEVMSLFAENAVVVSPLYGRMDASLFYRDLFEDTQKSTITPLNLFTAKNNGRTGAVHFLYTWTLKNGTITSFECVDIVQFASDGKIQQLTIIYNTAAIREEFKKMKGT
ncbi:MAG: nuclear transport factor 2 family protein [Euryarchaeota archaeon]|nr:nuclear transport factor 2 family protein [Euryarchaeota archaeon]